MDEKTKAIYDYIVGRCLWQFFSRSWDRERNINEILNNMTSLFAGMDVKKESNLEKCYYADAKILLEELYASYPWFSDLTAKEFSQICEEIRVKLIDLAVTHSLNQELNIEYY